MIDADLKRVIAQVESGANINAYRFERGVYGAPRHDATIIQRIVAENRCSEYSAVLIYSSSYGIYQMMGFNIYSADGVGSIREWWSDQAAQDATLDRFLTKAGIADKTLADLLADESAGLHFASVYNGPGNPAAYWAAMRAAASKLGLT